jgi:hypothetical protein
MASQDSRARSFGEQLDAEEAELVLRMQELRRRRYGIAAVSRLPNELLDAIFREFAFAVFTKAWAGRGGPGPILRLTHVCSAWRRVAISSRIWYFLDLDYVRMAREFLSRSSTGPLRIILRRPTPVGYNSRYESQLWMNTGDRLDALLLQLPPAGISMLLDNLTGKLGNLRSLSLSSTIQQTVIRSALVTPLLRRLRLERTIALLLDCQSLTDLTLNQIEGCTASQILSVLASSTQLRKVELSYIEVDDWPHIWSEKLHIPNLAEISMKEITCLRAILETIVFPSMTKMKIHQIQAPIPHNLFLDITTNLGFLGMIVSARMDHHKLVCCDSLGSSILTMVTDRTGFRNRLYDTCATCLEAVIFEVCISISNPIILALAASTIFQTSSIWR